ncbi:MAG: hypothetical protein WCL00_13505, partial [Bacteroidota bacterium]
MLRFILRIFILLAASQLNFAPQIIASIGQKGSFSKNISGFIENKGQVIDQNNKANPAVLYLLNIPGMNVQLRSNGFSYDIYQIVSANDLLLAARYSPLAFLNPMDPVVKSDKQIARSEKREARSVNFHRIDFTLLNSNSNCEIIAEESSIDYLNYYTSSTSSEGIKNVGHYQKVTYKNVYPEIDLEFIFNGDSGFKYNIIIRPGGNIQDIRLKIEGESAISFQEDTLKIMTSFGSFNEVIPESYILDNDNRTIIKSHFREIGKGIYGFSVDGEFPGHTTLVIDPKTVRLWGTYYGGSNWDFGAQCSVDKNGNVFMAGTTLSLNNIATTGSYQNTFSGNYDAFLVKFNAAGLRQWGTYFGGTLDDELGSCLVGKSGNIYISGNTKSDDGIATSGAHQTVYGGGVNDCFIAKFDQSGNRLWGTYYGGPANDSRGYSTLDKYENLFLAGLTESDAGIATAGSWQPNRYNTSADAFLAKFNSNGIRQWGTYFGGEMYDAGYTCTTDSTGNIYIAGNTGSLTNIASPGAHQVTFEGPAGGATDGFLAKFSTGGQRVWATYYGGQQFDNALTCATDNAQNVFLAGTTTSWYGIDRN